MRNRCKLNPCCGDMINCNPPRQFEAPAPASPVPPAGEDDDESEWFEIIEWVPTAVTLLVARFDVEAGEWVIGVEGPITAASAKAAGWSHFHRLPDGLPKNYSPKAPRPAPVPPAGEWCICQDCQRPYDFDLLVPDDVWNRIRPEGTPEGGGLLCPTCILRRTGWTAAHATDAAAPKPAVEAEPVTWNAALEEIAAERRRQVEQEGWSAEHDDEHSDGQMASAAACYALHAADGVWPSRFWPWDAEWAKPTTPRRGLVKAAALIVAEIERLDRSLIKNTEGSGAGNGD